MIIRPAAAEDIPVIQKLAHSIWPVAYGNILTQKQISYMLDLFYSEKALSVQFNLGHSFVIAQEDGQPVGFASYSLKDTNTSHYRLHKLYVLNNLHGKGIGKRLLQYILTKIKSSGATSIELNVNRYNKAIDFYKHAGFIVVQEEDIDIGSGYFMNDFVMMLDFEF